MPPWPIAPSMWWRPTRSGRSPNGRVSGTVAGSPAGVEGAAGCEGDSPGRGRVSVPGSMNACEDGGLSDTGASPFQKQHGRLTRSSQFQDNARGTAASMKSRKPSPKARLSSPEASSTTGPGATEGSQASRPGDHIRRPAEPRSRGCSSPQAAVYRPLDEWRARNNLTWDTSPTRGQGGASPPRVQDTRLDPGFRGC